jgi:hypothetical protein
LAYHSSEKSDTYHECKNCVDGKNIQKRHLVEGKLQDAKKCGMCQDLQDAAGCTYGTPTPTH